MKTKKTVSDLVIGIAFIALGIFVFAQASRLQKVKLGIGPGGFPRFIAVLLVILGAAQTISTLCAGISAPKMAAEPKQIALFLAAVGAGLLYVIFVPTVGFLLATPVLLFVMMLLYGNRKYLLMASISLASTVIVWILFTKVFMIFLPVGRLLR